MSARPLDISPEALANIVDEAGGYEAARLSILERLKCHYQSAHEKLGEAILKEPQKAAHFRREYARLTDQLVTSIFDFIIQKLRPLGLATTSERLALIAVGGYGRNEMAPYSDVDLLFLIPYKQTAWHESVIETMLYLLWDMGLKIGQSVRSIDESLKLARQDITIRTALLEQRFLAGDSKLADELNEKLRLELFDKTVSEFVEAKLEERENRHKKSGNIRYVLEPNVKEAKGGLRDLQTLYWLGKYITGVDTPEELAAHKFYEMDELVIFSEAENFLWAVRIILHLIAKRANDVLSFDMQVEVARALGIEDDENRRGVEIFMQRYFRAARQVGELTRVFLTELEARHVTKSRRRLRDLFRSAFSFGAAFKLENDRINFSKEEALTEDPLNMLRIFTVALETDRLIHPNAFRLMARHHELIDDDFRQSKEANRIFLSLLLEHGNPERVLRRMNEIGLLGAFIPEWARIDAMMQYNMYHSYTVDEHTIQCMSNLSDIEKGLLVEDLPVASGILKEGVNRRVLYLALLFHDIGKGLLRPHEEVGEEIARKLCPRFGLEDYEVELVAWLVRYHLELSDAAQKRDLSDLKTISDFAALAHNQERLDLLTVLTVCDIRGVGPKTWNNWKAMMIRELHAATTDYLDAGGVISGADAREEEAKQRLATSLSNWEKAEIEKETKRHYSDYWLGLSPALHIELAELLRLEASDEPRIRFSLDEDRDATRASFVMPDHPGLFARLCGAMSLSGANIVDARSYTSSDGMATAVLWVQDDDGNCYEQSRLTVLEANVIKILHGEVVAGEALAARSKIKKRERQFRVPTKIRFDNDGSRFFTIIEIDTRDRKGLLFDLSRTLTAANISISSAIIATYGEQAVDSFYVKDLFGLKIHSKSKREAIEKKLRAAIEEGYQEAMQ